MENEKLIVRSGSKEFEIYVNPDEDEPVITVDGERIPYILEKIFNETVSLIFQGKSYLFNISMNEEGYSVAWRGGETHTVVEDERARLIKRFRGSGAGGKGKYQIKAPMPGLVVKILTEKGASVKKGDPLIVVEAMKMENEISAPIAGTLSEIKVSEKQAVEKNQVMMIIEGG